MSVHNIKREPMQPGDIYVGRKGHGHDGYFGNPFIVGVESQRAKILGLYEEHARRRVASEPEFRQRVAGLHGKRLFCFCAPKDCHGDVLERMAAELAEGGMA